MDPDRVPICEEIVPPRKSARGLNTYYETRKTDDSDICRTRILRAAAQAQIGEPK
jgi:hypothetical protein